MNSIQVLVICKDFTVVETIRTVLGTFWRSVDVNVLFDVTQAKIFLQKNEGCPQLATPDLVIVDSDVLSKNGARFQELKGMRLLPGLESVPFVILQNDPDEMKPEAEALLQSCTVVKPLTLDKFSKLFGSLLISVFGSPTSERWSCSARKDKL